MKKLACSLAAAAVAIGFAASANAAAYIKFDGVDGEAKSAEWRGDTLVLAIGEDPVAVGLLLPAVQKVREAARRVPSGRPRKVATFEIDAGGRSWTLRDAIVSPTNDPYTVEISARCKEWTDNRTGKSGGDCVAPQMQLKRN